MIIDSNNYFSIIHIIFLCYIWNIFTFISILKKLIINHYPSVSDPFALLKNYNNKSLSAHIRFFYTPRNLLFIVIFYFHQPQMHVMVQTFFTFSFHCVLFLFFNFQVEFSLSSFMTLRVRRQEYVMYQLIVLNLLLFFLFWCI
jgi:hypothetical protein